MTVTLSIGHKALVQETFQQVLPVSHSFMTVFYDQLFEAVPETKSLFKTGMDFQRPKFVAMLLTIVTGLDHFETLTPNLQELAKRHIRYRVKAEYYSAAGNALLKALAVVLGKAFTPEAHVAWAAVYDVIATICVEAAYPSDAQANKPTIELSEE